MKRKLLSGFLMTLYVASALGAGGAAESSASSTRASYLAAEGAIAPPEEVHIDSYIASLDYNYANPIEAMGITLRSGNRQLSLSGQEEVIHIGIQAK